MGVITTTQKAGYDSHVIDDAKHRVINDTGTTSTELFSASKIISDLAGKSDTTHNHTGVYEPADATILKDADIGSTVQAYDATILVDADIGSTVQAYNANTTTAGNTFNGISQLVQTDVTGKLPAIDGSQLTNLASGFADPMTTIGDVIIRNATNVTARLGIGTAGQVLGTSDGVNLSYISPAGGGDALVANPLSQFAATTSLQLAGVISDETGSGALVFATSPTLVTPSIGVATGTSFNSITALSSTTPIVAGTAAIGTSTTVAKADHVHPAQTSVTGNAGTVTNGVYTTDIGTTVQAYDATILKDADIGVNVQAYDATNALTSDITYETLNTNGDVGTGAEQVAIGNHVHTGVYEPSVAVTTLTSGTTINLDFSLGTDFEVTLDHNASFTITNLASAIDDTLVLRIKQGTTGGTGSFHSDFGFVSAPTLSTGTDRVIIDVSGIDNTAHSEFLAGA